MKVTVSNSFHKAEATTISDESDPAKITISLDEDLVDHFRALADASGGKARG